MNISVVVKRAVAIVGVGAALLAWAGTVSAAAAEKGCLITLIEEAEVPSQEAGALAGFRVQERGPDGRPLFHDAQPVYRELHEGDEVVKGDVLAQIDDSQVRAAQNVADMKLKVAEKKASEDIMIRYAQAAWEVAKADYARCLEANAKVPGAVTKTEMQEKWLKAREEELSIEKARHEMEVATAEVGVQKAEADAAALEVDRHQLKAPLDGIVVERAHHTGEWVKPGDQVLRIVRMDRLRVKAYLNADLFSPADVDKHTVRVTVTLAHGEQKTVSGKVVFASPIVEAGPQFLIQAEVDNVKDSSGHWVLRPGLTAEMEIKK